MPTGLNYRDTEELSEDIQKSFKSEIPGIVIMRTLL
jgi:hypothetical protein